MRFTTTPTDATSISGSPIGRPWSLRRSAGYAALIAPTGIVGLAAALAGRDPALRWVRRTAAPKGHTWNSTGYRPRLRLVAHYLMSVLLGLVAWMLFAIVAMMIARGALYGIVDPGPYDDSWGGPSHAGAWLVHFVMSLPVIALALMLVTGVARLHYIVAGSIYGHRPPRWAASMAVITCVGAAVFFIAWLRQI